MNIVKRYPLAAFFVLTYGISWLLWVPFLFFAGERTPVADVFWILGGFGPLISALMVTLGAEGKAGAKRFFQRLFNWRIKWGWYSFAFLLPVIIYLLAFGLYLQTAAIPPQDFTVPPFYFYPLSLLFVVVLGGGQEEPGWRGFALPRLQSKYSPFASSIILGVFWALWHVPLFFSPTTPQNNIPFGWYLLNALALSIVFTWLYNRTGGSILLAILLHGGVNAPSGWFPSELFQSYGYFTLATCLVAVILVLIYGPGFFK